MPLGMPAVMGVSLSVARMSRTSDAGDEGDGGEGEGGVGGGAELLGADVLEAGKIFGGAGGVDGGEGLAVGLVAAEEAGAAGGL